MNIQSPSNDHVQSSYFFDRNNGFLLVGERYIWETDDGGKTFSKIPFEDWYVIKQFSCFSKEEWWLSTMGFGIRKTTDGGKNWVLVNPPTNNPLYNDYPMRPIYSIGKGIKYLPGWNGEIYKTTDDGITWNKTVLANSDLRIKFDNLLVFQEKDAWLVGSKGAIFYNQLKNNSVIKPQIIPNDYYLFQNYPNPFNPTTTIKYSIPNVETRHASSLQHITLKVYDMLGREVATLVNEEKAPGNYELKFDGGNLTSGVYFYRLQASSFSETKKFMLLK
ncbi:MAG: T9SS type A sorting domain-containing protein [Melioribacteraceae bacterium]